MITAYLDESHHSTPEEFMFVAGFWGKQDQWLALAPRWKEALGNRPSLHMNRLRWNHPSSERRIRDLLARLGPIPYECGLTPVYGGVKVGDYIDLIADDSYYRQFISGYVLCLGHILTLLLETLPPYERIKIVCEAQNSYQPSAQLLFRVFQLMAANQPLCAQLKSIEFVAKDSTMLLQAADYLAYSLAQSFKENGGKKDLWCRPIHGEKYLPPDKPFGAWLPRHVARETILQIKEASRKTNAKILL